MIVLLVCDREPGIQRLRTSNIQYLAKAKVVEFLRGRRVSLLDQDATRADPHQLQRHNALIRRTKFICFARFTSRRTRSTVSYINVLFAPRMLIDDEASN